MSNKSAGFFIGGLLLGSAIGTVVGVLIAPRTGRDTRQLLKKSADALPDLAEDVSTSVQLQADRVSESALRKWDKTLARLQKAVVAGIEASRQERIELQQPNAEAQTVSNPSVPNNKL